MIRPLLLTVGFVASTLVLLWAVGEPIETPFSDQVSRTTPDTFNLQPALRTDVPPQAIGLPQQLQQVPAQTAPTQQTAALAPARPTQTPVARPAVVAPAPTVLAAPTVPATRPVARPSGLGPAPEAPATPAPARIRALASEPLNPTVLPAQPPREAAAAVPSAPIVSVLPSNPEDKVNSAILTMGLGVVNELKKPRTAAPQTGTSVQSNAATPLAPTQPPARLTAPATRVAPVASTAPPASNVRTYTVQPGDSLPGIAFRYYGSTVAYLQILAANTDVLSDPAQLAAGMVLRIPDL